MPSWYLRVDALEISVIIVTVEYRRKQPGQSDKLIPANTLTLHVCPFVAYFPYPTSSATLPSGYRSPCVMFLLIILHPVVCVLYLGRTSCHLRVSYFVTVCDINTSVWTSEVGVTLRPEKKAPWIDPSPCPSSCHGSRPTYFSTFHSSRPPRSLHANIGSDNIR
jgi:hypothetical protein